MTWHISILFLITVHVKCCKMLFIYMVFEYSYGQGGVLSIILQRNVFNKVMQVDVRCTVIVINVHVLIQNIFYQVNPCFSIISFQCFSILILVCFWMVLLVFVQLVQAYWCESETLSTITCCYHMPHTRFKRCFPFYVITDHRGSVVYAVTLCPYKACW